MEFFLAMAVVALLGAVILARRIADRRLRILAVISILVMVPLFFFLGAMILFSIAWEVGQ